MRSSFSFGILERNPNSSGYRSPIDTLTPVRPIGSGRAQTSVEMLVVLAIGMVILLVLVDFTNTQFNRVQSERSVRAGQASMEQLVAAINAVYTQGPGATKQISVIWPEGIDSAFTQISGHSIRIRVNNSDIGGTTIPPVTGNLPLNSGAQLIRLRAYDGFVSIGLLQLDISPTYVLSNANRDENKTVSFSITNNASESANLVYVLDWNHSDVNAVLVGGLSESIDAGSGIIKDLNFFVGSNAVGTYAGNLTVQATFSGAVETQVVPLAFDVRVGSTSLLSIFPSTVSITGFPGDTNKATIQLCNLGNFTISGISFTPSSGGAGSWVQGVPMVSELPGQTCEYVDVNASIPDTVSWGTNVGFLSVQDYSGAYSRSLPLSVFVKGMRESFLWDWNGAAIGTNNVTGFKVTNIGSKPLTIVSLAPYQWASCDTNHSQLSKIRFNGATRFSGFSSDGDGIDVADFNLPVLTTWTNNSLVFAGIVNDDGEQFASTITFSDETVYDTGVYGPGCVGDVVSPAAVQVYYQEIQGDGTLLLGFDFPGDDNYTGRVVDFVVKQQPDSIIDTEEEWLSAAVADWSGAIQPGGAYGQISISNLTPGFWCFAFRGYDENNNSSPLWTAGMEWGAQCVDMPSFSGVGNIID